MKKGQDYHRITINPVVVTRWRLDVYPPASGPDPTKQCGPLNAQNPNVGRSSGARGAQGVQVVGPAERPPNNSGTPKRTEARTSPSGSLVRGPCGRPEGWKRSGLRASGLDERACTPRCTFGYEEGIIEAASRGGAARRVGKPQRKRDSRCPINDGGQRPEPFE